MDKEINKSENSLQNPFKPHESKLIELSLKRKIVLYEALEAVKKVKEIILYAYSLCRFHIDDVDLGVMSGTMYEMILEIFPAVTLEEFKESAKRGVLGDYGDFNTLSVKTFMRFISDYLRSEERLHKLNKYKEECKKEEPKPVTIGQWKEIITSHYNQYRNGDKSFIIFHEKCYMLLMHLGRIEKEENIDWQGHLLMGKEILRHTGMVRAAKNNDNSIKKEIELFTQRFDNNEMIESERNAVEAETRKLRYFAFFDYCIKNNIDNIF